jgi:hypothetical protein
MFAIGQLNRVVGSSGNCVSPIVILRPDGPLLKPR